MGPHSRSAFIGAREAALILVGAIFVVAFVVLNHAQSSGPVGAYGFSEGSGTTTADVSGNGNNGTLTNGPAWTTSGRFGNGLVFDGSNDYVSLSNSQTLTLTDAFSFEAWVYPTASTWHGVVGYNSAHVYELGISSDGIAAITANLGGTDRQAIAPSAIELNTWTHLAATYDGSVLKLYVNGTVVASNTTTGSLPSQSGPVWIGKAPSYGVFQGRVDEVRIYDRALSANEVVIDRGTPVDENEAFQVSLSTPAAGAVGIATTPVTATFSRPITTSTLTTSTFTLPTSYCAAKASRNTTRRAAIRTGGAARRLWRCPTTRHVGNADYPTVPSRSSNRLTALPRSQIVRCFSLKSLTHKVRRSRSHTTRTFDSSR